MNRPHLPNQNEFQRVVSSRHFRSTFFLSLIICIVLYTLIGAALINQVSSSVTEKAVETANAVCADMQGTLIGIQSNAVFMGSLTSVQKSVAMEEPELEDYIRISSELSAFSNSLDYESVDIFLLRPQRVYMSRVGMYDFSDYPGQDLIELMESGSIMGSRWLLGREYNRYYGENYPMQVATYLLRLPANATNGSAYIAIHLSYKTVSQIVDARRKPDYGILLSYQGVPIYSTEEDFEGGGDFFEDASNYAVEHGFLEVCSGEGTDVQCAVLVPKSVLWAGIRPYLPAAAGVLAAIFLFSAICAYLYSAALLRPVDRLVRKAGSLVIDPGNEFDQLNSVFDRLSDEVDRVQLQMQRDLPLVREQILLTLLSNYTEVPEDYSEQGITFPHDTFAVVLAALPERVNRPDNTLREPLKMIVRRHVLEKLGSVGRVYSAFGESQSVLFLVNADDSSGMRKQLQRLCKELSQELHEAIAMPVVLSVGICPKGVRVPYQACLQARRAIPFVDGEEGGVYVCGPGEYGLSADPPVMNGLAQCVLDHDMSSLRTRLSRCFEALAPDRENLTQLRRFSQLILCHVQARLIELDIPSETASLNAAMKKLDAAPSYDACMAVLLSWFSSQIEASTCLPEKSWHYVREAVAYIEEHYRENLTIPQIAKAVSVNPVYLNKLFKLSTGKTISEYLNYYRIEASKSLLLEPDATVASVGASLGYNDVRSFIRFFRKFTGVTPKDFRQQNLPEGRNPA